MLTFYINNNYLFLIGVIVDDKNVPVQIIEIKCPFKGKTSTISDLINDSKYIINLLRPQGHCSVPYFQQFIT